MSVFRKHKSIVDRAASDRARHKKKIERAIKESIKDVIAEESIIGQNGTKKIRIPVRGIKEYRFIYGNNENNKTVGSGGDHSLKRGQKIGKKLLNNNYIHIKLCILKQDHQLLFLNI